MAFTSSPLQTARTRFVDAGYVLWEKLGSYQFQLVIDKAKIADQGNYRVEATNAAGSMSSKAPLSVQGTLPEAATMLEQVSNSRPSAPETLKIKRPLQDVTVEKGTKILLSVEVEGQPKTVKWYKGTEQVTTTRFGWKSFFLLKSVLPSRC